jgi:hypothetical protein
MEDNLQNQRLLESITRLIAVQDTPIYFPNPVVVKTPAQTELCRCYGAELTHAGELKVMDPEQEWEVVKVDEPHSGAILHSLYHRMKSLAMKSVAHNY